MLVNTKGEVCKELDRDKTIIIWGASARNRSLIDHLGIKQFLCVDSSAKLPGTRFDDYPVYPLEVIRNYSDCVIVTALVNYADEIIRALEEYGIKDCYFYKDLSEKENDKIIEMQKLDIQFYEILDKKKSYTHIHFISDDKFVSFFYTMLEQRFDIEEHLIIYNARIIPDRADTYSKIKLKNEKYHNVLFYDEMFSGNPSIHPVNRMFENERFEKLLCSSSRIYIHSGYLGDEIIRLLEKHIDKLADKTIFIPWGGDTLKSPDSKMIKKVISKVKYVACMNDTFRDRIAGWSDYRFLPIAYNYSYIDESMIQEKKDSNKGNVTRILLEHSANKSNCIEDGIRILQKFANENITVYCPLSYGDPEYRDQVIAYGSEVFGEKFHPITEFMGTEEYYKFLMDIDIAVFSMREMKAATTILFLDAVGTKIYLREMFWGLAVERKNYVQYESLENETYAGFCSGTEKKDPAAGLSRMNSHVAEQWEKLFTIPLIL